MFPESTRKTWCWCHFLHGALSWWKSTFFRYKRGRFSFNTASNQANNRDTYWEYEKKKIAIFANI